MAFNSYIQIDGIEGQSTDVAHTNWIDVVSFSHGATQETQFANQTNAAGRGVLAPLVFVHLLDKATPNIQKACMSGQNIANLKIAKAEEESALLGFEQALLNAGEEVSTTLGAYQTAVKQAESRQKQVDQLEKAAKETWALFQHDRSTTYLETLTAQQSLISAQLDLISDKFDRMQAVISLYQALGGGRN